MVALHFPLRVGVFAMGKLELFDATMRILLLYGGVYALRASDPHQGLHVSR